MEILNAMVQNDKSFLWIEGANVLAGENLTTELVVGLCDNIIDTDIYLEFSCPNNVKVISPKLTIISAEGCVKYQLPYQITRYAGLIDMQLISRDSATNTIIFKTRILQFEVSESINAQFTIDEYFEDIVSVWQTQINTMLDSLSGVSENIAANASSISDNASAISTNSSNISSNASSISSNASAISTNASNASTNASAISSNASAISTNASDIITLAGQIPTSSLIMNHISGQVIGTSSWEVSGTKYKSELSNTYFNSNSVVLINYSDASKEYAYTAEIYKYNTSISNGLLTIYASYIPSASLTLDITIIKEV